MCAVSLFSSLIFDVSSFKEYVEEYINFSSIVLN